MKKSLIVAVALVGIFALGGCTTGGIYFGGSTDTIDAPAGYLAIPRHVFGIPLSPQIYSCEDGACKRAN